MSELAKLLKPDQTSVKVANPANLGPDIRKFRKIRSATDSDSSFSGDRQIIDFDHEKAKRDIERIELAREQRRAKVLATMEKAPESERYFWVTDYKADSGHVILTVGVRDVGTCELSIDREKYVT